MNGEKEVFKTLKEAYNAKKERNSTNYIWTDDFGWYQRMHEDVKETLKDKEFDLNTENLDCFSMLFAICSANLFWLCSGLLGYYGAKIESENFRQGVFIKCYICIRQFLELFALS